VEGDGGYEFERVFVMTRFYKKWISLLLNLILGALLKQSESGFKGVITRWENKYGGGDCFEVPDSVGGYRCEWFVPP
jgi:hypothetical protein